MIVVQGKPFIYYMATILNRMGVTDIVLSVGYLKEQFGKLDIPGIRLVDCDPEEVNKSVLRVPGLKSLFVLANGDVLPILKWKQFLDTKKPRVAVKTTPIYKDAGICIVDREDVRSGKEDCGDIRGMMTDYENFACTGNLHIGTPEGLRIAEDRLRWWWKP